MVKEHVFCLERPRDATIFQGFVASIAGAVSRCNIVVVLLVVVVVVMVVKAHLDRKEFSEVVHHVDKTALELQFGPATPYSRRP